MKHLTCPHCGSNRMSASRVPKDVVVVLPCPSCHELVVVFRNKAAAANREILENGTHEQRKAHIAEIVMEFLDSLVFRSFPTELPQKSRDLEHEHDHDHEEDDFEEDDESSDVPGAQITQREIDRFVKMDLQRIDNASYFKKHFN